MNLGWENTFPSCSYYLAPDCSRHENGYSVGFAGVLSTKRVEGMGDMTKLNDTSHLNLTVSTSVVSLLVHDKYSNTAYYYWESPASHPQRIVHS